MKFLIKYTKMTINCREGLVVKLLRMRPFGPSLSILALLEEIAFLGPSALVLAILLARIICNLGPCGPVGYSVTRPTGLVRVAKLLACGQ